MAKVRVVQLKYVQARALDGMLPPLYQPLVHSDDVGTRAIITAPSRMLDDIAAFIAQVDVPGRPAPEGSGVLLVVRAVSLKYLTVAQAQALLPPGLKTAVTGDGDSDRATVSAPDKQADDVANLLKSLDTGTDAFRLVPLQHTSGKDVKALLPESLKAFVTAADDGTTVGVSAPPRRIEEVLTAVRNIDGQLTAREKPPTVMQTVHLDYLDSGQLAKLLPKSALATLQAPPEEPKPNAPTTTSTDSSRPPDQPRTPDANRTVLLSGTPEQVADAMAAIKALDKPAVQVMMEALVVETTKGDLDQFEIHSQGKWWGGDNTTGTLSYGNTATTVLHQVLWLVTKQKANIKASPRVVAQDGKEANVRVAVNQYFSIVTGPVGNPYVTLQSIDATIGLTMTPRVAIADKLVTCTLQPQVDDVTGQGANALPIITRRSASTSVRVADGQVIAIGGLLQEMRSQVNRKIPLLGDIPFLGQLFRSHKVESSQREITIFVVPHILDAQGNFEGPLLFERYTAKEQADDASAAAAAAASAAAAKAAITGGPPVPPVRPVKAPAW